MVYPLVSFVEDDFNFMGTIASRENVQELLTNLVGQLKITSSALQTVLQWLVRAEDQVDQIMDVGVYTRGVRRTIEDLYPRIEAIRHSQQAPLSMMEAAEKVISQSGALGLILKRAILGDRGSRPLGGGGGADEEMNDIFASGGDDEDSDDEAGSASIHPTTGERVAKILIKKIVKFQRE